MNRHAKRNIQNGHDNRRHTQHHRQAEPITADLQLQVDPTPPDLSELTEEARQLVRTLRAARGWR